MTEITDLKESISMRIKPAETTEEEFEQSEISNKDFLTQLLKKHKKE